MPYVPAFCNTCGTIFSSGIFIENCVNMTLSLSGNTAGPCPKCGGIGHIPDGVFSFIGDTIKILNAPERTTEELQYLFKILKTQQKENINIYSLQQKVEEESPQLSPVVNALLKNKQDVYQWITIIIMVLQLILGKQSPPTQINNSIQTTQVINYIYQNSDKESGQTEQTNQFKNKKIGRNEKCPCGSGKKYKCCHGKSSNQ